MENVQDTQFVVSGTRRAGWFTLYGVCGEYLRSLGGNGTTPNVVTQDVPPPSFVAVTV